MGQIDELSKEFFRKPEVFSDTFNTFLFGGRQIVDPGKLEYLPTTEILRPFHRNKALIKRERDLLMKATIQRAGGVYYVLFGIEVQALFDRTMPIRVMLYDLLNYLRQLEDKQRQNREKGLVTGADYLSGLREADRLTPVITLVVFLSDEPWTMPRSLHDLLDTKDELILKYVPNYPLNIITPESMSKEDIMRSSTELKHLLLSAKLAGDKNALADEMERNEIFWKVSSDTASLINALTHLDISINNTEETINMAKIVKSGREFWIEEGIEKGIEKGRQEGRLEGRQEGRLEGRQEGHLEGCLKTLLSLNLPFDTMVSNLMQTCKLTQAEAQQALKSIQAQQ